MCGNSIDEKIMKKIFSLTFLISVIILNINTINAENNIIDVQIKKGVYEIPFLNKTNYLKYDLPFNYFDYPLYNNLQQVSLIIMAIVMITTVIIYLLFGQESRLKRLVKPFRYTEYSSAEIGFLINDKLTIRELSSLIGYWACKGYLKIIYSSKEKIFWLKKLKPLQSKNSYENHLFNLLFSKSDVIKENELPKAFFNVNMFHQKQYQKEFKKNIGIYNRQSKVIKNIFLVVNTLVFSILLTLNSYDFFKNISTSILIFLIVIIFLLILAFLLSYLFKNYKILNKYLIILIIIIIILGYLLFAIGLVFYANLIDFSIKIILINFLLYLISIFTTASILKRTDKNHNLYEEILGLRNYISSADSQIIKNDFKSPINYYECLVYAYILNVEDILLEKIKNISISSIDTFEIDKDENSIELFINTLNDINFEEKKNKFDRF